MAESFPSISFDIGMGELFSDIDVDYEALITYMQQLGCDDDMINDAKIYFKSISTVHRVDENTLRAIHGAYDQHTGAVMLYPSVAIYQFDTETAAETDIQKIEDFRLKMSDYWSEHCTETLKHELGHKIRHPIASAEANGTQREYTGTELARLAMSKADTYEEDPEEAECNQAALVGPKGIVRFEIKPHPEVAALAENVS